MIILTIVCVILLITTATLFFRGFDLIERIEIMEDTISEYQLKEQQTGEALQFMIDQMREIDLRGSFESDDEVGSVFKELKNIIESYNNN